MDHNESWRMLRRHSISWVVVSPLLVVMAVISTVKPDITYYAQLVTISIFALIGFIAGLGGLNRKIWAARWMHVLAWIGTALIVLSGLTLPFTLASEAMVIITLSVVAIPAVLFLLMARSLRRILVQLTGPNQSVQTTALSRRV